MRAWVLVLGKSELNSDLRHLETERLLPSHKTLFLLCITEIVIIVRIKWSNVFKELGA